MLKLMFENEKQSDSCFFFLHNIGFVIYNPNTKKICTDPQFLAHVMACFAFHPEHDERLFGKKGGKKSVRISDF